jgi:hypothetical protein
MYGSRPELVDGFQISGKHVWMLVIFGGNVLLDCLRQRNDRTAPKREDNDVAVNIRYRIFPSFTF